MDREALNVLLVVLEGARVDHLACAGYERDTMPFLDQVAREGVRFPQAFTCAPSRLAAHASLLTGLFPSLHGATEETRALAPAPRALPELLKAAGYRTAAFCPDPWISPATGFGRGFDRFYTQHGEGRITGRAADYARRASDRVLGRGDAGARRSTHALLDWLRASPQPFFALIHYREPLRPIRPPAPYDRAFPSPGLPETPVPAANEVVNGPPRQVSATESAALAGLHDGALRYADLRLKEIGDTLAAEHRWDRTLFIVTSSYGEDLGERGTLTALPGLCDAVLRVPLILRCPGRIPAGFVVEEFAQPVDVLPTVAALTGCGLDAPVQGRALLTASGATPGPRAVIAEAFRQAPGTGEARVAAVDGYLSAVRRKVIRTRREKFIWRSDEANALFDLSRDPEERNDLAAAQPERADRLRRVLFDWLAESERWSVTRDLARGDEGGWRALERQGAAE